MSPHLRSPSVHLDGLSGADVEAFIGQQIRLRRMLMGLTQTQLASLLDVTFQHVHQFERGHHLNASRLYALSRVLMVSVEVLFPAIEADSDGSAPSTLQESPANPRQVDLDLKHDGREQPQALAIVKAFRLLDSDNRRKILAWMNDLVSNPNTPAPRLTGAGT